MDQYYKILGVPRNADLSQIKKAFRAKAKKYHPDISQLPNAEELFIELNEAYEYLVALKEGKIRPSTQRKTSTRRASQNKSATREKQRRDTGRSRDPAYQWDEERERARERARAHARMKYQAYKKTDAYRWAHSGEVFVTFLYAYWPAVAVLILTIVGVTSWGAIGLFLGLLVSPLLLVTLVGRTDLEDEDVWGAFLFLLSKKRSYKYLIFAVNIPLFFMYTLRASFPIWLSALMIAVIGGLSYLLRNKIDGQFFSIRFIFLGWAPLLLNFFFFLNALLPAAGKTEEVMLFTRERAGLVINKNLSYNPFIHMFIAPDYGMSTVIQLEEGLFGIQFVEDFDETGVIYTK